MGSTRLPGKALADIGGLPMIERVRRKVLECESVDRVLVATDDERIADVVRGYGGEAVLTGAHPSGTHRVAAAVADLQPRVVINVQGDLPLLDPAHVDALVEVLDAGAPCATLAAPLVGDPNDPSLVKVVRDQLGYALYFSRAPIPYRGPYLRHVGLYGFLPDILQRAIKAPAAPLERIEDLEQLRWLSHGIPIAVGLVNDAHPGVDTPEHLESVRQLVKTLSATPS